MAASTFQGGFSTSATILPTDRLWLATMCCDCGYTTAVEQRRATLDWKGETRYEQGFKVREEISTSVGDYESVTEILLRLGFVPTIEIDRRIAQYELGGATVRFEEYPDMDPLVEVEGTPEAIEQAIVAIGLSRSGFTSERLPEFMARFEARTGRRAALSQAELSGATAVSPRRRMKRESRGREQPLGPVPAAGDGTARFNEWNCGSF